MNGCDRRIEKSKPSGCRKCKATQSKAVVPRKVNANCFKETANKGAINVQLYQWSYPLCTVEGSIFAEDHILTTKEINCGVSNHLTQMLHIYGGSLYQVSFNALSV